MYEKIRSEYLRKKIRGLKWTQQNREYIHDLLRIEQSVLGHNFGWMTGYLVLSLKEKYPKEFEAIYKELSPKDYAKEKMEEQRGRQKELKLEKKQKLKDKNEEEREKKLWVKMGGSL